MRWAIALGGLLAAACAGRTEIVVTVHSDVPLTVMSGAQIVIAHEDGTSIFEQDCIGLGTLAGWPDAAMTLGLVPDGDVSTKPFRVVARGFSMCGDAAPSVSASALVEFVTHERLALPLELSSACLSVQCPQGQTCDPSTGACVSDTRSMLPTATDPDLSAATDGGGDLAGGGDGMVAPFDEKAINGGSAQSAPALVSDGLGFKLGYLVSSAGTYSTYLQPLDGTGNAKTAPVAIDSGDTPLGPVLAADGNGNVAMAFGKSPGTCVLRVFTGGAAGMFATLSGSSEIASIAYDPGADLFRDAVWDGGNVFIEDITVTTGVIGNSRAYSYVSVVAASAASSPQGTLNAWIGSDNTLNGIATTSSGQSVIAPYAAVPPIVVAPGISGGYVIVSGGPSNQLQVKLFTSTGVPYLDGTTTVGNPDRLAAAGDGSGGVLAVLETAGQLSFVTFDATAMVGNPVNLFAGDGKVRHHPSVAFQKATQRYFVVYALGPSADTSSIYGFFD